MITLEQLYTDPRFKKMSVEELEDFIGSPAISGADTICGKDWIELEPKGNSPSSKLKAQKLFERLHMDNTIRLTEGMGVVNATLEEHRAIVAVAKVEGVTMSLTNSPPQRRR